MEDASIRLSPTHSGNLYYAMLHILLVTWNQVDIHYSGQLIARVRTIVPLGFDSTVERLALRLQELLLIRVGVEYRLK
jgi:hypothetical protein